MSLYSADSPVGNSPTGTVYNRKLILKLIPNVFLITILCRQFCPTPNTVPVQAVCEWPITMEVYN